MRREDRLRHLFSRKAWSGWGILVLVLWNLVAQIDTSFALPSVIKTMWDFFLTIRGILVLMVLGFTLLGLFVWEPKALRKVFGLGNPTISELDGHITNLGNRVGSLEVLAKGIPDIDQQLQNLTTKVEPPTLFDPNDVWGKVTIKYSGVHFDDIGNINRTLRFDFIVENRSSVWINTTGQVQGSWIFQNERLIGVPWVVVSGPVSIRPEAERPLEVRIPFSDRMAETLAFMPAIGHFQCDFSEMMVELVACDEKNEQRVLSYHHIGEQQIISVPDQSTFQRIRSFVKWRKELDDDSRID